MAGEQQIRSEVEAGIRMLSVAQLEDCCEKLGVPVADEKKGDQKRVSNILKRYLVSEEVEELPDQGSDIYKLLHQHIKSLLDDQDSRTSDKLAAAVAAEKKDLGKTFTAFEQKEPSLVDGEERDELVEKVQSLGLGNLKVKEEEEEVAVPRITTKVELTKIRDFKVSGGTVPESIDYMNLCNQMLDGIEAGYSAREVRNGVVRAMKPGSTLRRFFDGPKARKMKDTEFRETLRTYYKQEDSETLQDHMRKAVQAADKDEMDFLLDMIDLRDKIELLAREEGCPLSKATVDKRFKHVLSVGFRRETIRLEMQAVLKNNLTDLQLMDELQKIVKLDKEHREKTEQQDASVTMLDADRRGVPKGGHGSSENKNADIIAATVERVVNARMNKIESKIDNVAEDVSKLKSGRKAEEGQETERPPPGKKPFIKCEECQQNDRFCTHCRNCGKKGHKEYYCPDPPKEKNE